MTLLQNHHDLHWSYDREKKWIFKFWRSKNAWNWLTVSLFQSVGFQVSSELSEHFYHTHATFDYVAPEYSPTLVSYQAVRNILMLEQALVKRYFGQI